MPLQLAAVTFDCDDPLAVAEFWSKALDLPVDPDPSPYFATIGAGADGNSWLFVKVPEAKTAKNRCHPDLFAESRDAVHDEVDRLTGLGATLIREPKEEFGIFWATFQDVEGNEFCVAAPH